MGGASSQCRKLGPSFHRTFCLNRPALASLLRLSQEFGGCLDSEIIRQRTTLGSVYVEAMPKYAYACGLLDLKCGRLTPLGKAVSQNDPSLNHSSTLWLMHYHLAAPHGCGPGFWHHLVTRLFRIGMELTAGDVSEAIAQVVADETGRSLVARTARSTAGVFLGTYVKSDALGKLGILKLMNGENRGSYRVLEPIAPSVWTVAYALADYWDGVWSDRVTVNLSDLVQPAGFASLFLMGSQRLEETLRALQHEGLLEVHRVAPPYQLVRLWPCKEDLLQRLYE